MRFRSFWPITLWTLIIFVLSFTSGTSFPSADWMDWFKLDKWIHAFLYFILFLSGFIPIDTRGYSNVSVNFLLLTLYCLFIGVFTELIQAFFLSNRSGDIDDMVANSFGVVLAIVFVRFIFKKWPWKEANDGTVTRGDGTV